MTISSGPAQHLADRPRYSDGARGLLRSLEGRLDALVLRIERSAVWQNLTAPGTSADVQRAILSEVMFSVHQYQPLTTEAGYTMLGRLPKTELKLLGSLLAHKTEEASHGAWATRDFMLLGGDRARLQQALTPACSAMVAVWDRMARCEDPFGYLGAEYLFEALTMRVAAPVMTALGKNGVPADLTGFLIEHATEDVKHTNLVVHWILDVATRHAETPSSIIRCYDLFEQVYPLPVWDEALRRANGLTGGRS